MISVTHFPVLAVMGLFLGAFLVEIFGSNNKTVREVIAIATAGIAFCLTAAMIFPVMRDGEVISYWMGDWEPVEGYRSVSVMKWMPWASSSG